MGKKRRLQFCVGEMDATAGVAEVLHPCCPLPCIGSLWYLSVSVLSCLPTQQEVVCLYFFYLFFYFFYSFVSFFSLPGCLSAIWAHWNWLSAGSDKPWNQPKKGQKCVDCRKDVISFISLGLDHLVAWNDSMVVNEYGWGDEFLPKASRSMSKMANNITSLLSEVRTSKQWVSKVSARLI